MTFEVELKFAVHDPGHFSRMVESLGGEWGQPMFQVDRYFNQHRLGRFIYVVAQK